MKFWEVLKAVEEGKIVQWNYINNGVVEWEEFKTEGVELDLFIKTFCKYRWRIKPKPKILYVAEQKNGLFFAYESESSAKNCNFESRKGPIRKFVEVMED